MKFWLRSLSILVLVLTIGAQSFAQTPPPAPGAQGADGKSAVSTGPRRHLATIIFAGLGGAILGLSTLSFYGRPQDYLGNIAIGFAIGVIGGTIYVTYNAATKPDDFYGPATVGGSEFPYKSQSLALNKQSQPTLHMRWEF